MATAEQIKSLIRSHISDDAERFFALALQIAAHEAVQGHGALAHDIREIVDQARKESSARILHLPKNLQGLVYTEEPDTPKAALIVTDAIFERVNRIIHEYRQRHKLKSHGLTHRRKILLIGPPGTGKTMTARILAHELRLQLHTIQVDRLVTKFMGETSAKLRQIFDIMPEDVGVYLFDEFDAIGGERSMDNDVGEMRRVLNAFLQFIEQDTSDSMIVAATNNPKLLDRALFRRFDDTLYYDIPAENERKRLIQNTLGRYLGPRFAWKRILFECEGLSHSDIVTACSDAIKHVILEDRSRVDSKLLLQMLSDRRDSHSGRRE